MKTAVVVDANIGLKWIIDEEGSEEATALLDKWNNQGITMLAPYLFMYEITNILYQNVRKGRILLDRAMTGLGDILLLGMDFDDSYDDSLGRRAIELTHQYDLKATYDAYYLALAEREKCELWTADSRMWRAVQGKISWVHDLSEYKI